LRRLVLVLTVAALVATMVMVSAVPGSAQTSDSSGRSEIAQADPQTGVLKKERRERREKVAPEQKKASPEQKSSPEQKAIEGDKALPKTGGFYPGAAQIAGLGGAAMLIGGGLLVYRRTR